MSWAARRRFLILLIVGAIIVAILALVSIATFTKTPSCADSVQNQGEAGVDCGGPCAYLCTAGEQPPTVLFTKALPNGAGRTDVIALVENKNTGAAAKDVPYRIALYGTDQVRIQEVTGTLDLPQGAAVPVYVPGIASGKQTVAAAFLSIEASAPKWFTPTVSPSVPLVSNTTLGGTTAAPRIEAVLTNPIATALSNVRAVVMVRDAQGEVIAASQTIVSVLSAQGKASAIFTWNSAFPGVVASIEVVPIIPVPGR